MSININQTPTRKNNLWLWIIVLVFLIGGGLFFFLQSAVNPEIVVTNDIKKLLPKDSEIVEDIDLNAKITSIFESYPFLTQLVKHTDLDQLVSGTKGKANPFAK